MRYVRLGIAVCVVSGLVAVFSAAPAFAHAVTVSGEVGCSTSGQFQITWTITNDVEDVETADVSSAAGGLSASQVIVPGTTSGNPLTSNTVTQTLPISLAGQTIRLDVSATWSDGFGPVAASAEVTLEPPCEQPPTTTTTGPNVEVGGLSVAAEPIVAAAQFTG